MFKQTTTRTTTPVDNRTPLQKVDVENYKNKRRVHLFADINKRFKLTRSFSGLSQAAFAEWLGINVQRVKAIEEERVTPSIDVIRRWQKKSGRSFDWIINGTAEAPGVKEGA